MLWERSHGLGWLCSLDYNTIAGTTGRFRCVGRCGEGKETDPTGYCRAALSPVRKFRRSGDLGCAASLRFAADLLSF